MKQYKLHISAQDINHLHDHAENSLPAEAVALVFGKIDNEQIHALRAITLQNVSPSKKTSFSINPEIQYRLYMEAEEKGEDLVCIFHSHPAPPSPSSRDLENMRLNPVVWLIASKNTGRWLSKAYVLNNESPLEIEIIQAP